MKVIISHDVDHLRPWEHKSDLIIPKFAARFGIEWCLGRTKWAELCLAVSSLRSGNWQHIDELMAFDESHRVPATYFVGVRNGRKLCYPLANARAWIVRIQTRGFDVGLHGIEYQSTSLASEEFDLFTQISGTDAVGVRIHNIGYSPSSVLLERSDVLRLRNVGYAFSSTTHGENDAWASGPFWEFPVHLMDGYVFMDGRPWKNRTLDQMKESTIQRLRGAVDKGVRYFTLIFHDVYFCDYYRDYKEWYIWLVDYLKTEGYSLCSYRDALTELNGEERILSA